MDVQRLYLDCTARAVKTRSIGRIQGGHGQNINQQRSRALDGREMCLSSP